MIIATNFPGDSYAVASAQHDVYYEALNIIVKTCNKFALFAKNLMNIQEYQTWGSVQQFDHRTLQFQHDLIATVWRYKSNCVQQRLDCDEDKESIQHRWLDWLQVEVNSWIEKSDCVRLVQIILTNQNNPLGQKSEALLSLAIMEYFPDVPWDEKLKTALERDAAKTL